MAVLFLMRSIVGHCSELKTSIMFSGSKLAHLNFVADSILGHQVNLEAGAIIANYRNESENKEIHIHYRNRYLATGVEKFGANAVIAPGSVLPRDSIVARGALIEQSDEGVQD